MSPKSEVRDKAPGPQCWRACLHCAVIEEVNRRQAAGECPTKMLDNLVETVSDMVSGDPRAARRAELIAHIVGTLPSRVSEKVDQRLKNDPDYLRNTIKFNEGMLQ